MRGDCPAYAVCLFDNHFHLVQRYHTRTGVHDHLDEIRAVVKRLSYGSARLFDTTDDDVFLIDDLLRFRGDSTELAAGSGQRACGSTNARASHPALLDCI